MIGFVGGREIVYAADFRPAVSSLQGENGALGLAVRGFWSDVESGGFGELTVPVKTRHAVALACERTGLIDGMVADRAIIRGLSEASIQLRTLPIPRRITRHVVEAGIIVPTHHILHALERAVGEDRRGGTFRDLLEVCRVTDVLRPEIEASLRKHTGAIAAGMHSLPSIGIASIVMKAARFAGVYNRVRMSWMASQAERDTAAEIVRLMGLREDDACAVPIAMVVMHGLYFFRDRLCMRCEGFRLSR